MIAGAISAHARKINFPYLPYKYNNNKKLKDVLSLGFLLLVHKEIFIPCP
jgi:hypothetical protein